ncbi:hypothetical protein H6P81_016639 [Aristolochia fimbriata]|uniref:DNA topoisomerase I n=1 Tax=Aristolochia fimbriata TaxID=158543 RepID=A0AAV7EAJ4_ARIFI|nr:hypothetical protein H6P81_016639 [Aristolochia fimbriata]
MAVHGCLKPSVFDNGDDDDAPIVFRRNSSGSKQSQANSAVKKPSSSQRQDDSSSQNSNLQKGKTVLPNKSSIRGPTNSSTLTVQPRSSELNSANGTSMSKPPIGSAGDYDGNLDDSDDDKPLSARYPNSVQKSNSSCTSKDLSSPPPNSIAEEKPKIALKKSYDDDSEDEIPLSAKFGVKSAADRSRKNTSNSNDQKATSVTIKVEQNGIVKREPQSTSSLMSSKGLNKRPLDDGRSARPSSVKKAKPVDPTKIKQESKVKEEEDMDDEDNIPLGQKKKPASSEKQVSSKKVTKVVSTTKFKKTTKMSKKNAKNSKYSKSMKVPPGSGEGQKWTTLVHSGVIFPPPYKSHGVKMLYNGQPVDLTPEQEEVATMFAVMKDTEYATKQKFIENFMNDWKVILGRNHVIKKFDLCDFTPIYEWHQKEKEKKKQMTAEEKKAVKEAKLKQEEKFMWAIVDGVKEKVGNFRVEPPGLFRGRGEHPKMGKLKRRIRPSDITINIGKDAPIPECPIPGERWKEVKHDNTVTWLAYWNDPINPKESKYVFLAASSSLKGQSDKEKYEKARMLKNYIKNIRATYTKDFTSKDVSKRQIAVATYLIDKLALRAGNEKDDDEADTVGCCTLKVENVTLMPENKLKFDFLGKDSIRYENTVPVEAAVYKAVGQFQTGKKASDDLFDKLDTAKLNAHLKELMPGLTAKVFRTYNASFTLDDMLTRDTKDDNIQEKLKVYQTANREVAIICNHQRTVSKSHDAQMARLDEKIAELKRELGELNGDLSRAKKGKPPARSPDGKTKRNLTPEALEKKISQITVKIDKMEMDRQLKDQNKNVALGTSKINYLDPRITVAWCKRHEVPIEKIFNKSLLAKFSWAMDVEPSFKF